MKAMKGFDFFKQFHDEYPGITRDVFDRVQKERGFIVLWADDKKGLDLPTAQCFYAPNYTEVQRMCFGRSWENTKVISWQEIFGGSDLL